MLEVATEMSLKRTDAALLTKRGRVVGIVTDHDLTRYCNEWGLLTRPCTHGDGVNGFPFVWGDFFLLFSVSCYFVIIFIYFLDDVFFFSLYILYIYIIFFLVAAGGWQMADKFMCECTALFS